ncbi:dehydrodolichyl diphosphate synthetase [Ramicandelaber brevisporus]|nr:dehydrodolichyl diphosphate synthetase [Ramicandelaber brevisporus]
MPDWQPLFWSAYDAVSTTVSNGFRSLALNTLRAGPVPRHIAFIMDGNRRFARNSLNANVIEGHKSGASKLEQVLSWCLDLGVECVSVYAFSIDNFNRSKDEVDGLMNLARHKLVDLATNSPTIKKHQARIRVIGNKDLLPTDLREAVEKTMQATAKHTGPVLNICFAYLGSEEIAHSIETSVNHALLQNSPAEITVEDIERNLRMNQPAFEGGGDDDCVSIPLDLLVRTSGEIRLSDFMMWQASRGQPCHMAFVSKYWPEFSLYDLFSIIISYQLARR